MRVGIFLGTQHPKGANMREMFENHVQQVRAIRDGGYDGVWLAQHYLTYPDQFFQPNPLLARLAAETGDLTVGTNILVLPLHNIIDLAEQYATIDIITGGRLVLGVALGYRDIEYDAFGINRKTRAKRFDEQLEALDLLWTQENATYHGEHVNFENVTLAPRPMQSPRPPIWVGAAADPAVRRAAQKGDNWIATSVTTASAMKAQVDLYHQARAEAGRPKADGFAKCVELFVAETKEKAIELGGPYIAEKYRAYYAWGMGKNVPGESGEGMDIAELIKDRFIVGSPEDCIRECIAQRDELGVTDLLVRMNFPGMPLDLSLKTIKLFAEEVLPNIR